MKKSVILAILIIYIASFFIVGFFGEKARSYDQPIKVEALECVMDMKEELGNIDTSKTKDATYLRLRNEQHIDYIFERVFKPEDVGKGIQVIIEFKTNPRNATNPNISFTVSKDFAIDSASDSAGSAVQSGGSASVSATADTSAGAPQEVGKFIFKDNSDGTATFMFYEPSTIDVIVKAADGVQVKARVDVYGSWEYFEQYG